VSARLVYRSVFIQVLPFDKECGRRLQRVTLLGEEPLAEAA
jgi:hypothetical protein